MGYLLSGLCNVFWLFALCCILVECVLFSVLCIFCIPKMVFGHSFLSGHLCLQAFVDPFFWTVSPMSGDCLTLMCNID